MPNDYGSQLQQPMAQQIAPPKPPSLYDQHSQACAQWQQACHEFAAAAERKQQAKDYMDKVSQEFAKFLQDQVCDPTVPPVPREAVPMNGHAAQQAMPRSW